MFLQKSNAVGPSGVAARGLLASALIALALITSPAQAAEDAAADAEARILSNSRLENVAPLQFGRIIPSGSGGAVMINASTGALSTIGQVITVGSNQTRARFTLKAPIGVITLLIGDPTVDLKRVGDTRAIPDSMSATLTHQGTSGFVAGLPFGLLPITAEQEIHTGGSLVVQGDQATGAYEGNFSLMVFYL